MLFLTFFLLLCDFCYNSFSDRSWARKQSWLTAELLLVDRELGSFVCDILARSLLPALWLLLSGELSRLVLVVPVVRVAGDPWRLDLLLREVGVLVTASDGRVEGCAGGAN